MIIITETSFPPESSKDIGKVLLKQMGKMPEFITVRGPYTHSESGKGISGLALYECDNAKLAEGLKEVSKRMIEYFEVKGFTYSIKVWAEPGEALKSLGLG